MNEPRVAVEGEDDRLVRSEQRVEVVVREAMRMLTRGLQLHEIHDVDNTHLQLGRVPAGEGDGSESPPRRHVSAANHHNVGLLATVVAGPLPDSEAGSAVLDRLVHRYTLRGRFFLALD